jgi:hypothetical protein
LSTHDLDLDGQTEPPRNPFKELLLRTGFVMEPVALVDGESGASLAGLTLGGRLVPEVECPAEGKASALRAAVSAGEIPLQ